ncbi:hypothetical protein XAC2852_820143 [Xanthomonas citri pv. citri]|nr:hypothetical protein XAC2852_820143 [Xanthomonas citri pv. citri]
MGGAVSLRRCRTLTPLPGERGSCGPVDVSRAFDARVLLRNRCYDVASTLAEQVLALFIAERLARIGIDLLLERVGALGRRARGDGVVPALQMGEGGVVGFEVAIDFDPRIAGHVGNAVVVAGQEGVVGQALVEHAMQATHLGVVALDRVRNLFRCIDVEVTHLTAHRAQPAHLPEQPLQCSDPAAGIARQEAAGLLGQIQQDRAGLEHALRTAAIGRCMVDDGRHLVVGRNLQECRFELFALADVDRLEGVLQPGLFQKQRDFVPVGRGPVVQIDHRALQS